MDLQSNSFEKISIKWTVVRRTLFSCLKWTFCLKIISKQTQVQKKLHVKRHIFFEKLLFTMFYSLVYILNNFFHSVFYPLNCFGWSKKFKNLQESRVCNQQHDSHVFQLQYILLYSSEALECARRFDLIFSEYVHQFSVSYHHHGILVIFISNFRL